MGPPSERLQSQVVLSLRFSELLYLLFIFVYFGKLTTKNLKIGLALRSQLALCRVGASGAKG
jgi:hypothetical protein